jgi:peptidoglycan/xylan/chitin deacetylase (PgdA/CDA1 family)
VQRLPFKPLLLPNLLYLVLLFACSANTPTPAPFTPVPSSTAAFTPEPTLTSAPLPSPTPTPLPAVLITSGDWTKPYVALTFDVCQDPAYPAGYDAAIVDVLTRYNVPATFFLGGDWMRTHPDETKALAQNGNFELGDHSWSHPDFTKLTPDQMSREIVRTENMLLELTGHYSRLFRPPFGTYNDQVLQVVARHGMYTIEYDVISGDPDPSFDAATLLAEVKRTVRNGSIIIMHANGRGWHTAEALPSIIEYLHNRGFLLVTVSQLIGLEPIHLQD